VPRRAAAGHPGAQYSVQIENELALVEVEGEEGEEEAMTCVFSAPSRAVVLV